MIRTTFSALALSASTLALAPAALADPACPAEIVNPSAGATVSPTPTIQATADNRSDCDPNVRDVRLQIVETGSGNSVYEHSYSRGQGLLTGRAWSTGMLLLDHQVPAGELNAGQTYRAEVYYSVPTPFSFDNYAGMAGSVTFTVRGGQDGGGQDGNGQTGTPPQRADHTIVISGSGSGSDYTIFGGGRLEQVDGRLAGRDVTVQGNDEVSGDLARGVVGSGSDGFNVYGAMPSIVLDDPDGAVIEVDGNSFAQIVITSENISGETGYTITGGGRLEQVDGRLMGYDVTIQGNDRVQANRADGEVGNGADGFRVYGAMPQIALDNPDAAVVFVNGEPR